MVNTLSKKDMLLMAYLRQNARFTLTTLSKKTKMPISTIYDKLKSREQDIIKKHTSILDFSKLGFGARANIMIKVSPGQREELKDTLIKNTFTNSVYRVNNGYDFMIEGIFKHVREVEEFLEYIERKFSIEDKKTFFVIEELKREAFLSNPAIVV